MTETMPQISSSPNRPTVPEDVVPISNQANIATLPDLAIHAIFNRLPIMDLGLCSSVCKRWFILEKHATKQRRSLVLMIGQFSHEERQLIIDDFRNLEPSLMYKIIEQNTLSTSMAYSLVNTFNQVHTLYIALYHLPLETLYLQVAYIVRRFGPTLVNFGLFTQFDHVTIREGMRNEWKRAYYQPILDEVNQRMPLLRSFILHLGKDVFGWKPLEFPAFKWLHYARFHSFSKPMFTEFIYNSLKRYGELNKNPLARFDFDWVMHNGSQLVPLLQLSPQLCAKLLNINTSLETTSIDNLLLHDFCRRFTALTTLTTWLGPHLSFSYITQCLSLLVNLDSLNLKLMFCDRRLVNLTTEANITAPTEYGIVRSLQSIRISGHFTTHSDLCCNHFARIFPNLSQARIFLPANASANGNAAYAGCVECQQPIRAESASCLDAIRQSWAQCPALRNNRDKIVFETYG